MKFRSIGHFGLKEELWSGCCSEVGTSRFDS